MDDAESLFAISSIVVLILIIGGITHAFVLACELWGWVVDKVLRYRYGRR